jgi:cysteine desulfurase
MKPIYLDYNATTPIDPDVRAAMMPYFEEHFGNASSAHWYGRHANEAVQHARQEVADLIGANAAEIIFCGGGSEASNLAIQGAYWRHYPKPAHIITCATEHPATLNTCRALMRFGCEITELPVDGFGQVDPDAVGNAMRPDTFLISIMHSNNEIGTLQPIAEIAAIAKQHGVLFHTDAAQSIGKLSVHVRELGVDLLTIVGHKCYAPKGSAALFIRQGVQLGRIIHGADHERGLRAGTENVPYIVALGAACRIAGQRLPGETARLQSLRDRLQRGLGKEVVLNGHPTQRLPNTLNVSFPGHIGAELLVKVPGIAASTGSACHEGKVRVSPVLTAMGIKPDLAEGAIRFSVGRWTTEQEIDDGVKWLRAAMKP